MNNGEIEEFSGVVQQSPCTLPENDGGKCIEPVQRRQWRKSRKQLLFGNAMIVQFHFCLLHNFNNWLWMPWIKSYYIFGFFNKDQVKVKVNSTPHLKNSSISFNFNSVYLLWSESEIWQQKSAFKWLKLRKLNWWKFFFENHFLLCIPNVSNFSKAKSYRKLVFVTSRKIRDFFIACLLQNTIGREMSTAKYRIEEQSENIRIYRKY